MTNGEWRMANGEWRMANGEWRMTREFPITNDESREPGLFGHSGFVIDSSFGIFVIRH
jgi:hypothetical protein